MKILLGSVSQPFGGVERRLLQEASLLRTLGHEVFLTVPKAPTPGWYAEVEKAGALPFPWQPYKFAERRQYYEPFRWLSGLSGRALTENRFDLLHVAMSWTYNGLSMAEVARVHGVPVVLSLHCKFSAAPLSDPAKRVFRATLENVAGIYGVSNPVVEAFSSIFKGILPAATVPEVIRNGVDTNQFAPSPSIRHAMRTELGIGSEDAVVMYCGRLDRMKRPDLALQAFQLANGDAQGPDRLLMVGAGPEYRNLQVAAKATGIADRVVFTDRVDDPAPYYAASDVYISTSLNFEGCPLAACEALASGLPIVAPDDDVYRDNFAACSVVHLAAADSPESFARTLSATVKHRRSVPGEVAAAARRFASDHFSVEAMNRKLSGFYGGISIDRPRLAQ